MQMREARRLEVESNPNYLKSSSGASKKAPKQVTGDSENSSGRTSVSVGSALPAVELIAVPGSSAAIPIPGLASSEKYLEEERRKQQLAGELEAKLGVHMHLLHCTVHDHIQ